MLYPDMPIIWYTGAEFTKENVAMLGDSAKLFDAIMWGKLKVEEGRVVKTMSKAVTAHVVGEKILISEYNPNFEDESETHND